MTYLDNRPDVLTATEDPDQPYRQIEHLADTVPADYHDASLADELRAAVTTLRALQERISADTDRLAGLEEVSRAAIETITLEAERKLTGALENGEARIVDALTLAEQQQMDFTRWRDGLEQQVQVRLRELDEWDETLSEKKAEVESLREMAEAALSLASGDLDKRWEGQRRELRDILATFEDDERARWDSFIASASTSLITGEGGDPAIIGTLQTRVNEVHEQVTATLQQQREQIASQRSELRTLIESEIQRATALLEQQFKANTAQLDAFHTWHRTVEQQFATMRENLVATEQRTHTAQAQALTQAQTLTLSIQDEVQRAAEQIRSTVHGDIAELRAALETIARDVQMRDTTSLVAQNDRSIKRLQRQMRGWHTLTFVVALVALIMAIAVFAMSFFHVVI